MSMKRRRIIAGNWKMNHGVATTRSVIATLRATLAAVNDVDVVVCPVFTSLAVAVDAVRGSAIAVGAQNVHWERNGAYTGEISADMLKELSVTHVIVGHSERRQYFGETDDAVNKRLAAAVQAGLIPIVCVGETLAQRMAGQTESVVTHQVHTGLACLSAAQMANVIIAYEPVWAIGTGVNATPAQAQEVHALIRNLVRLRFDEATAAKVRIQYGGSVKPENSAMLMSQPDIDGALVGGASLDPGVFSRIVQSAS